MDLFEEPAPGDNTPEFTVSEISGTVKKLIETELGWVRVRGEVGRVMKARSGHLYFDLKDDRNALACTTWKGQISALGVVPEEGMEVIAEGKMTAGFQSKYQLNAQRIAVAGEGALMALLERRKKQLAAEGLFDAERKRDLPYLPEVIGVVTSLQGAVIRDILHRLRDRFPRKVLIWPVAVQGAACAPEVARAIAGFNALTPGGALPRPDLLIVARGGGSVEDLWGFNEEIVARAAASSEIPLISAVGHETDTTLIDFVSDKRAPTPTAAAEMAVPVRRDLLNFVDEQGLRLWRSVDQGLVYRGQRLRDLARALPRAESLLETPRQRLDLASERLPHGLRRLVDRQKLRLSEQSGSLRPTVLRRTLQTETARLADRGGRLGPALERLARTRRVALEQQSARLSPRRLQQDIAVGADKLRALSQRLADVQAKRLQSQRERLTALDRLSETLSYKATLERGYAVVRGDGNLVTRKAQAETAAGLEIEFADGTLKLGGSGSPKRRQSTPPPEQGNLF